MSNLATRTAAVLLLAVTSGCAGGSSTPATEFEAPSPLRLEVDAGTVSAGDRITVTVTARNDSFESIDFGQGSSSCWFGLEIVHVETGRAVSHLRACTRDYVRRTLQPGEDRVETMAWSASEHVEGENVAVPTGTYRIRAVAPGHASAPVTVEVVR